jgi:hypothetical protein
VSGIHRGFQARSQETTSKARSDEDCDATTGREVTEDMKMNLKQSAIAVSIAASALVGGLGLTHAMAATKTPSSTHSKSSSSATHKCPNDRSNKSTSTNA